MYRHMLLVIKFEYTQVESLICRKPSIHWFFYIQFVFQNKELKKKKFDSTIILILVNNHPSNSQLRKILPHIPFRTHSSTLCPSIPSPAEDLGFAQVSTRVSPAHTHTRSGSSMKQKERAPLVAKASARAVGGRHYPIHLNEIAEKVLTQTDTIYIYIYILDTVSPRFPREALSIYNARSARRHVGNVITFSAEILGCSLCARMIHCSVMCRGFYIYPHTCRGRNSCGGVSSAYDCDVLFFFLNQNYANEVLCPV